ncbi:lipase family protein (macronuclear) [Tetrahymena thermophila SB210]|uniref:Lipase family protein n=1 Tax=Tetrahymena thermophila (strain SB210) TaxID=312017 RepID=I7M456_TETTS|nr:lipase family protein [Tetrahymena thermophila SB210]EAS04944.1 lipase family protein [Tetrahymena thermophila SB210]|eukprot:XP_001025189.1 lipase family protein [Tetrahymena thermophila SB210]
MKIHFLVHIFIFINLGLVISDELTFDIQRAMDFLFYQKVSYCPSQSIEQWNCGTICKFHDDMKDVRVLTNTTNAAQGYIGYHNNYIVIAFRGTQLNKNWLNNFDFIKVDYPKCQKCTIHRGFFRTFTDLSDQLFKNLQEMLIKYPNSQIIITGHSLGGAVATIAAVEIQDYLLQQNKNDLISEFYTFGQPRVGNQEFVDYFNSIFPFALRIVNNKDIVVRLPMRIFGYSHIGTEIWFDQENNYTICSFQSEDPNCSVKFNTGSTSDHVKYLDNSTSCTEFDMQQNPQCYINGENICPHLSDNQVIEKMLLKQEIPIYDSPQIQTSIQ